jgi:hypothetical protein
MLILIPYLLFVLNDILLMTIFQQASLESLQLVLFRIDVVYFHIVAFMLNISLSIGLRNTLYR